MAISAQNVINHCRAVLTAPGEKKLRVLAAVNSYLEKPEARADEHHAEMVTARDELCRVIEEEQRRCRKFGMKRLSDAAAKGDIYATVDQLRRNGIVFQDTPDTYYEGVNARVEGHRESLDELARRRILIDGSEKDGILLQIFTQNVIGPIFFEIIQRKGNEGFGEGNFQALFESIERDQLRRGVL